MSMAGYLAAGPLIKKKELHESRVARASRKEKITTYVRENGKVSTRSVIDSMPEMAQRSVEIDIASLVEENVLERAGHGYIQPKVRGV